MNPARWQKIESLLEAALEYKPAERGAFLDAACSGDDELRREVESLLAANEQAAASFLKSPAIEDAAQLLAAGKTHSMLGKRIGSYQIISHLGSGGMGEVYLAQDTKLGRRVAIKLLPSFFTNDEQRLRRFQQEARAASALNHPYIVTVFDFGQVDSIHFMATEYVEGHTLRAALSGRKMKLVQAIDVAVQVASALAAAHQAGIVHRDIKPENLMLRPDGYVKVLDFGLAKLTQTPESRDEALTLAMDTDPGTLMGTASYMSPEQARGQSVDARTDIFSLGVVLYEMVAGRAPFEGETTSDLLAAILEKQPPPLARYEPDAPAEIQWIVTKSLRKEKDERYQTITELLSDLKELKQGLDAQSRTERDASPGLRTGSTVRAGSESPTTRAPQNGDVTVRSTSSTEYLVDQIKRHRRGAALALTAAVVAIAATAYVLYIARGNKTEIHSIAVLPFTNSSADPDSQYLSDGITESLINSLSKLQNLRVTARTTAFTFKERSVDPRDAGRELNVDALLTGRVTQRGDTLGIQVDLISVADGSQLWGEHFQRKFSEILAVQGEIAREISEKMRLRLTGEEEQRLTKRYTENVEAYQLYLKGRYFCNKVTEEDLQKSLGYFNQAIEKDSTYALAYAGLADTYVQTSFLAMVSPGESYGKAKEAATRALELDNKLGEAYATLGLIHIWYDWNWPAGQAAFRRAIELSPNYATAHQGYGRALTLIGRFDEGLTELKRAQELEPLSLIIDEEIGTGFLFARRYDEAIKLLRRTLDMDPRFAFAYIDLSIALERIGKPEEAVTELQKALSLENENVFVLSVIGFIYASMGEKEKAESIIRQLKELSRRKYVSPQHIARVYAGLGDRDNAFEWIENGFQGRDYNVPYLRVDPTFDSMVSDPRFVDLQRRIGLPQ